MNEKKKERDFGYSEQCQPQTRRVVRLQISLGPSHTQECIIIVINMFRTKRILFLPRFPCTHHAHIHTAPIRRECCVASVSRDSTFFCAVRSHQKGGSLVSGSALPPTFPSLLLSVTLTLSLSSFFIFAQTFQMSLPYSFISISSEHGLVFQPPLNDLLSTGPTGRCETHPNQTYISVNKGSKRSHDVC